MSLAALHFATTIRISKRLSHMLIQLHRSMSAYRWIPPEPVWTPPKESDLPSATKINSKTAKLLEKLALVDFRTVEAITVLEEAIRNADELRTVDTSGVEPMTSVLEATTLTLRHDYVTDGGVELGKRLLDNSVETREGYWVAPSGNVTSSSDRSSAADINQNDLTKHKQNVS